MTPPNPSDATAECSCSIYEYTDRFGTYKWTDPACKIHGDDARKAVEEIPPMWHQVGASAKAAFKIVNRNDIHAQDFYGRFNEMVNLFQSAYAAGIAEGRRWEENRHSPSLTVTPSSTTRAGCRRDAVVKLTEIESALVYEAMIDLHSKYVRRLDTLGDLKMSTWEKPARDAVNLTGQLMARIAPGTKIMIEND